MESLETNQQQIRQRVEHAVAAVPVFDIHTHLYAPAFGDLLLAGIDDLLVYHYMVAEAFRYLDIEYKKFWALPKERQAEIIWDALFIQHSPISEACRGVLTTLNRLGLDVRQRDLPALRRWFAGQDPDAHVSRCMELAGVESIGMTNSPFDDLERPVWERGYSSDSRFVPALRIDPILMDWENTAKQMASWGYSVDAQLGGQSIDEVRRFLVDWSQRMNAAYIMVSLPPSFRFPEKSVRARLIEAAVLPFCRETGLAFALMMGVKRAVNPGLSMAGDGVGLADMEPLQHLCANYPDNKFMVTVLARENQHELCVLARKFRNLHVFGCWWFMNVPLLIEEVTRMRLELIGTSFTAQHSDARVIDQVVYKWDHSRAVIGRVLADEYARLAATGWAVTAAEIERDVRDLFGGACRAFLARAV